MELLKLSQAARRFGVSRRWLRREALAGRVPCLLADKRPLFNAAALEAALAERAAGPQGGDQ